MLLGMRRLMFLPLPVVLPDLLVALPDFLATLMDILLALLHLSLSPLDFRRVVGLFSLFDHRFTPAFIPDALPLFTDARSFFPPSLVVVMLPHTDLIFLLGHGGMGLRRCRRNA
jgi:hypothetical protein